MRSGRSFRFTLLLLLTVVVLGAELTELCHGRRDPTSSADQVAMVHEVQSPPRKDKEYRQRNRRMQDLSESKRVVPQGPNPLHN